MTDTLPRASSILRGGLALLLLTAASACVAPDGTIHFPGAPPIEGSLAENVPAGSWKDSNGDWLFLTKNGDQLTASPRSVRAASSWNVGVGVMTGNRVSMEHKKGSRVIDQQVGTIAGNARAITWTNGSKWVFAGPEDRLRTGRWLDSNGHFVDVQLAGNNKVDVEAVSAEIKRYWTGGTGTLDGLRLQMNHTKGGQVQDRQTGSVREDGKHIAWSNGSTWTWQNH